MVTSAPRKALLLLDYQVGLCEDGPLAMMPPLVEQIASRGVLDAAANVLAAARNAGCLVVHVRLAFDPTYVLRTNRHPRFNGYPDNRKMLRDSPEAQIVDALKPADGEPVIDKSCVDPFVDTGLLTVLAAEGVQHVIMGGVATNLVVESAARHACDAGLAVTVVEDMCASFRPDFHAFSIENMMPLFASVSTSAETIEALA